MNLRRTKIVCTIGPSTESPTMIRQLIQAGMNVARLNFAHATHEIHGKRIETIRRAAADLAIPVAILQDLPGPKSRTGQLKAKTVKLEEKADFTITTRDVPGDEREVSVSLPSLPHDVSPGNIIFLDDGIIKLEVVATTDTDVMCKVAVGGPLGRERGINVPGVKLSVPSFTDQDIAHLLYGIECGIDFVALSFIRKGEDVMEVREFLKERNADIPIIAKIEKHEALDNIGEILDAVDGVMIARGDLGIEIPIEKVPMAQKEIARKCNHAGKFVIVATQMLESMEHSPFPTRAEVTDVANAVFDGSDAIMLSGETAIGKYPLGATTMMARIALEAESALPYEQILLKRGGDVESETDDAISYDACHTAQQLGASAIVAFTTSGSTARRVSKYRPRVPVLALTSSNAVWTRLALSWGVYPCRINAPTSVDHLFDEGTRLSVETGMASKGDLIIITGGVPIGMPGSTNLLKVQKIE